MPPLSSFLRIQNVEIRLAGSSTVIGRHRACDLRLNDASVSRLHACVQLRGAAVFIEDMGSRNGTSVNGLEVKAPMRLSAGATVQVGAVRFSFLQDAGQAGLETLSGSDTALIHRASLSPVRPADDWEHEATGVAELPGHGGRSGRRPTPAEDRFSEALRSAKDLTANGAHELARLVVAQGLDALAAETARPVLPASSITLVRAILSRWPDQLAQPEWQRRMKALERWAKP